MLRTFFGTALLAITFCATGAVSEVACGMGGFLQSVCPDAYPVCCYRNLTQTWSACCPTGSQCDLDIGACVSSGAATPTPASVAPSVPGSDSDSSGSSGDSVMYRHETGGIFLSPTFAAVLIAVLCIFAMLGVVGMTALGIAVAHVWQRRRLRLHLERVRSELRASESGGSDSDDAEGEASVEPPSGTECALCLSRVKDTVLVPCGHMACCHRCAGRLTTCPLCRAVVRRMLRVDVLPLKPAAGVDAAATAQQ